MAREASPHETAESEIRGLIDSWSRALEARDLDGLVAGYGPDPLLFDAIPPYRRRGVAAIRAVWEACLPYLPERFASEFRDVEITVDGDLAFMHGLHRFAPEPADHPSGSTWLRVTVCYRRIDGAWRVAHEHVSIPFDPMTQQSVPITDPDAA